MIVRSKVVGARLHLRHAPGANERVELSEETAFSLDETPSCYRAKRYREQGGGRHTPSANKRASGYGRLRLPSSQPAQDGRARATDVTYRRKKDLEQK